MSGRAGIFDPWRQSPAVMENAPPVREAPNESAGDTVRPACCFQFRGLRAGIFVWLPEGGGDDIARARAQLVDAVHRISNKEDAAKILRGWGVYLGKTKQTNTVVFGTDTKFIHVVVPVVDEDRLVPRAVDNLALALREVSQQFHDVRDTLSAFKVNPYLQ